LQDGCALVNRRPRAPPWPAAAAERYPNSGRARLPRSRCPIVAVGDAGTPAGRAIPGGAAHGTVIAERLGHPTSSIDDRPQDARGDRDASEARRKLMAADGKITSNDPRLDKALEVVRTNRVEAEKFTADPEAYLQAKGVDTSGLSFGPPELTDKELEQVAGGAYSEITICGSVGCIACVTVGN
jgi:hypothetical protein